MRKTKEKQRNITNQGKAEADIKKQMTGNRLILSCFQLLISVLKR